MKYLISVIFFIGSLLSGCDRQASNQQETAIRPNIIFFLTDDHRFDAMGFMGHPFLETPNMDRMANEGIHFNRAIVTTSLCSPSIFTPQNSKNPKTLEISKFWIVYLPQFY